MFCMQCHDHVCSQHGGTKHVSEWFEQLGISQNARNWLFDNFQERCPDTAFVLCVACSNPKRFESLRKSKKIVNKKLELVENFEKA